MLLYIICIPKLMIALVQIFFFFNNECVYYHYSLCSFLYIYDTHKFVKFDEEYKNDFLIYTAFVPLL